MRVFEGASIAWEQADPAHFTGRARVKRADADDPAGPAKVYRVEFEAEARTNWHAHSGPQVLLVVEGRCRVQKWGEPGREVGAGDIVYIPGNERHWHGAAPGSPMTHIALTLAAITRWLEPVSDEEYAAAGSLAGGGDPALSDEEVDAVLRPIDERGAAR
ncbi:MAG: cupin domain-containing protein [Gemmatimonadetes bacterium]|nr:cupin domain-containing protein [Gemmatimonadota bacterium]